MEFAGLPPSGGECAPLLFSLDATAAATAAYIKPTELQEILSSPNYPSPSLLSEQQSRATAPATSSPTRQLSSSWRYVCSGRHRTPTYVHSGILSCLAAMLLALVNRRPVRAAAIRTVLVGQHPRSAGSLPRMAQAATAEKLVENLPPYVPPPTPVHFSKSEPEFWRKLPIWENVPAAKFLTYEWNVSLSPSTAGRVTPSLEDNYLH